MTTDVAANAPHRCRRAYISRSRVHAAAVLSLLAACGSTPTIPHPAFIQADELPDVFLASFPGARAKQFASDPRAGRSSTRLTLPPQWSGTATASLSKSVEIYVLAGRVTVGDFSLGAGGYAWLPGGWSGMSMGSEGGATLLHFEREANPANVIQTPLITSRDLEHWVPGDTRGVDVLVLRHDPGSGARTWLERVTPGTSSLPWRSRPRAVEGYLLSGRMRQSECVGGEPVTAEYLAGGYFYRPAGAVHGGPEARAPDGAVWLLRQGGAGEAREARCTAPEPASVTDVAGSRRPSINASGPPVSFRSVRCPAGRDC